MMMALQSIGSIDDKHRLPAPKQFVAISVLWGLLFLAADTGYARIASRLSLLVLLTATVVGPFGTRLTGWLTGIAQRFAISPPVPTAPAPTVPQPSGPSNTRPN